MAIKIYNMIKMKALGKHIIADFYDCDEELLSNIKFIKETMLSAAKAAKTTIITSKFYKFKPFGVSGIIIIAESHLSIHTWPEYKFASVDFFTCGNKAKPWNAFKIVKEKLNAKYFNIMKIQRGLLR